MLLDAWRLAVGTLTAFPVTAPRAVDRRTAAGAILLAPIAVLPLALLVGLIAGGTWWLGLPALVVALLSLCGLALGSRGLHLDGLSDVADGLAASYDPERSLKVMKSGTAGPAGVVTIVLVLGLQAAALANLGTRVAADRADAWQLGLLVVVAVSGSRAILLWNCLTVVPAARADGLGSGFTGTIPVWAAVPIWLLIGTGLAVVCAWIGLDWWRAVVSIGLALAVVALLLIRVVRRFGGVTGDVFGASIELALAALLLGLL